MIRITLVPVGASPAGLLESVCGEVERSLGALCTIFPDELDPAPAFHPERQQYHSTELLAMLRRLDAGGIVVGVAPVDLYIPILTFVFGEAELGGAAAVVGYQRLREEFYGLPADLFLLARRTAKEVIHETGHVLGLTHCDDYECVMASTHSVERVDLKGPALCATCALQVRTWRPRMPAEESR